MKSTLLCCTAALIYSIGASAQPLPTLDAWEQKDFVSTNQYHFESDQQGAYLQVLSDKSSSGLFLEQEINLEKTPILEWSWKVDNVLRSQDEKTKKGDDFAARVYVVASTGPFPWQKKTICYVWSSYQTLESQWPNPYADNVIMLAANSGNSKVGQWVKQSRNIKQDLTRIFEREFETLDVIAIMTDTDNSLQKASAWYRDFNFK